jgi:solute carrier family 6 GABA transporter-like protein 1
VIGFVIPHWLDVFIIPERRDDWKQPLATGFLRDTTEGEVVVRLETGSQFDMTEGKKDDSVNNNTSSGSLRHDDNSSVTADLRVDNADRL